MREAMSDVRNAWGKPCSVKPTAPTDSVIYKGDDNKYYERINGQIIEIELPFEYPHNWSVLRLKEICQLIDGEKRNGKDICLDAVSYTHLTSRNIC